MNVLPVRKPNRLDDYDYSKNGAYFVTMCTKNRENILGGYVGATVPGRPLSPSDTSRPVIRLTDLGKFVDQTINFVHNNIDNDVKINKYVIMPNHVHIIIVLRSKTGDRGRSPLHGVVRNIKSYVSKWAGFPLWQKSFHDHVIRDLKEYYFIENYIENNPSTWENDCFYREIAANLSKGGMA